MTKVVINRCYGGFGLSDDAVERYAQLKGINLGPRQKSSYGGAHWYIDDIRDDEHYYSSHVIEGRSDPILIQVIEEMGNAADGWAADLAIVEIPDDVQWHIEEYDGMEWVAENHRTWT